MRTASRDWWWRRRVWMIPLLVFVALALPGLFGGVWAVDMGWYGGISRGIVEDGDFWRLHAGDRVYFNKPPLAFWLGAMSLKAFGGHDWAVRLPGMLCAAGIVAATVALVRRLSGPRVGLAAGVVMAATPELVRASTQFRLDVPHTLFIVLAALGGVIAAKREGAGQRGWRLAGPMLASGGMVGLALLTKPFFSPLAYVFMAPWLVWAGARRTLFWAVPAVMTGLAIAAPWHVSMALHYGRPFVDEYLGRQAIARGLGSAFESDPWWYYLKLIATTYWPWLAALTMALVAAARGRTLSRNRGGVVLAIVWAGLWIAAVSAFADKRRQYLLPAYPGLAWLAGLWLANVLLAGMKLRGRRAWLDLAAVAGLAVSVVVTATGAASLWRRPMQKQWIDFFAFAEGVKPAEIWAGAVNYNNAGMICAVTGRWPRTIEWRPNYRTPPPVGGLVLFSEGEPPNGAEVVFRSGRVVVVRWPAGLEDPRDHDGPPENTAAIAR